MLSEFSSHLAGLAAATFVRTWMGTLDMQTAAHDPHVDPVCPGFNGPVIGIFWHEYLLCPLYSRGHSNTAILTSRHRDANWVFGAAQHLGFQTVRGSTNRGGHAALLEIMRRNANRNLGISPDGPRGPRRKLAPGPIFLASKLQRPIVAMGVGYDRPWRLGTWDHFALPRPFSRARMIWSMPIQIPANLEKDEIEAHRHHVEGYLNRVTEEAETWAKSGTRYVGQRVLKMQPVSISQTPTPWQSQLTAPHVRWKNPTQM